MLIDRKHVAPALIGAIAILLLVIPAHLRPANFLADDTYFYLQVAHNIVRGEGSTFNGITPTNGYHPLWMLFCAVAMALCGGDKTVAIHIVLLMQLLLLLVAVLLFLRIARLLRLRHPLLSLPIFGVYFLTGLYGSEAHINAVALLVSVWLLLRSIDSGRGRDAVYTGLAMGLAFLARLDNILVIVPLMLAGLTFGAGDGHRARVRRTAVMAAGFLAVALPYLIGNAISYGHILPISGALKSSFPRLTFDLSHLALLGIIVAIGAVVSLVISLAAGLDRPRKALLRGLGGGVLLQCVYIACFIRSGSGWSWYYVAGVLNAIFAIPIGAELPAWKGWTRRLLTGAGGVLLILGIARSWYRLGDAYFTQKRGLFETTGERIAEDRRRELALRLRRELPAGSGVYVEEGPGALAYYSDLRILPRDGLISDFRYNDEILAAGAERYFREHGIAYYLGPVLPEGDGTQDVIVPAPLYDSAAGTLHLRRENLIFRGVDDPTRFAVGLWKL